jgi:hypothetical protein
VRLPLSTDEGLLVGSFKLSSRFLQDKVQHDYSRILPEMTLSRFAAVQMQSFSAGIDAILSTVLRSSVTRRFSGLVFGKS